MITINLPDDVAIEVMRSIAEQIGGALSNKTPQAVSDPTRKKRNEAFPKMSGTRKRIEEVITSLAAGIEFHYKKFAKKNGLRSSQVSPVLCALVKRGVISRVEPGVYRKAA